MGSDKYKCDKCGLSFTSFSLKANHIRWHHRNNDDYYKNASIVAIANNTKRFGKWIEEDVKCDNCDVIIHVKYREGKRRLRYCCSRSCYSSRPHSTVSNNKCSQTIKQLWDNGFYDNTSANNHLLTPKIFSSKIERKIVKYFKENYPDDGWKSGGNLKIDKIRLARDLWSDKLKVCFEYDGDWHFKNIHNQLVDKQYKDNLLEQWCIKNNYRLIRIDEKSFKNTQQIVELIYKNSTNVIKIGTRY